MKTQFGLRMAMISRIAPVVITLTVMVAVVGSAATGPAALPYIDGPAKGGQGYPGIREGIRAYRNVPYVGHGHERQKLDLYLPVASTAPLPVILWVHGGAWNKGSKDSANAYRERFVERGYAVASIGYRLSPDAPFPAQLEDCKSAVRWLRAHAQELNLDADHIAVWGASAGGHLAALLAATGHRRDFDRGEHLEHSSAVQAAVVYFGPVDLASIIGNLDREAEPEWKDEVISLLIGASAKAPANRTLLDRANPLKHLTAGAPPFLLFHGTADTVVKPEHSELLYQGLVERGVPVHLVTVRGAGHNPREFPSSVVLPVIADFFARHLQGNPAAANWPAAARSEVQGVVPAAGR